MRIQANLSIIFQKLPIPHKLPVTVQMPGKKAGDSCDFAGEEQHIAQPCIPMKRSVSASDPGY